jgi:hypothetical protein
VDNRLTSLRQNLEEHFQLPASAVEWLLMMFQVTQVFDDVADSDVVYRNDLDKCIWNTLVAMPLNHFFSVNAATLLPIVAVNILKWQASDRAEKAGEADARSFVWRAGFYDLCMIAVQLCHGTEKALELSADVIKLYGESFDDYRKEFVCQIQQVES